MNLHEIEKLLEKYFEGETSLSEEKQLRDFFASGDVPQRWKNLEGYFSFVIQEQDQQIEDADFDNKVMSAVKGNNLAPLIDLRRPWIYWIAGVAASVLILIAVFVKFDPFSKRIEDTYKDPQTAYLEARKILLLSLPSSIKEPAGSNLLLLWRPGLRNLNLLQLTIRG